VVRVVLDMSNSAFAHASPDMLSAVSCHGMLATSLLGAVQAYENGGLKLFFL
jgi:hypothetical protein